MVVRFSHIVGSSEADGGQKPKTPDFGGDGSDFEEGEGDVQDEEEEEVRHPSSSPHSPCSLHPTNNY